MMPRNVEKKLGSFPPWGPCRGVAASMTGPRRGTASKSAGPPTGDRVGLPPHWAIHPGKPVPKPICILDPHHLRGGLVWFAWFLGRKYPVSSTHPPPPSLPRVARGISKGASQDGGGMPLQGAPASAPDWGKGRSPTNIPC
jgi:hypothetical protein